MRLSPIRSGMWLCVDLVDDLLEVIDDDEVRERLRDIRASALDLLFQLRQLERSSHPEGVKMSAARQPHDSA